MKRLRPLFFLHRIRIGFAYTQTDPPAPSVVCFPCLPLSAINGRRTGKRNTLFIPYPSLSNPVNTVNEPTRPPKEESSKAKPCFYLCVHAVLPTHPSAVWLFRPFRHERNRLQANGTVHAEVGRNKRCSGWPAGFLRAKFST